MRCHKKCQMTGPYFANVFPKYLNVFFEIFFSYCPLAVDCSLAEFFPF